MNYLYDYHIHTTHSIDGKNTVLEVCKSAVEKGLKEIAITDHFESTYGDESPAEYNPNNFWWDIVKANEIFEGRLKIKMGVELGQPHLFPEASQKLLKSIPYDYVIGSAHKFPNGLDLSGINYDYIAVEDMCEIYLNQIKQLINQADFDCVGHIDLLKRYSTDRYQTRVTLMTQQEMLTDVLKLLISKGKGLEINTSGLRQAPKETMPGIDVLTLYHELGGEILTIGSDAHYAADVAKGLNIGIENARQAGFDYLTVFNQRAPEWIRINDKKSCYYIGEKKAI